VYPDRRGTIPNKKGDLTVKHRLTTAIALTLILSLPAAAAAGEITGRIQYADGSDCSGCKVSASIKGSGMTDRAYSDRNGEFRLSWSSDRWIDKLFVNGRTVRRDLRPGERVSIRVR
jgi:hypothetical protein